MPRKSQSSQRASSQRNRQSSQIRIASSQESLNGEDEEEVNLNLDEQVNDLVRYIVNRAGEQAHFKRSDLKKSVLPNAGPNFQRIIDESTKILRNVYGYNMIYVDAAQSASKGYIVCNALSYVEDPTEPQQDEYPEDASNILLLLILSHIFMSTNPVSEVSLYSFLRSLEIEVEKKHEIFGNVKDCINNTFKNKKYLNIEVNQISKKASYTWGSRAEKEISKKDILKFVCKLYRDRLPSSWVNQNRIANDQQYENHKEDEMEEVPMDI